MTKLVEAQIAEINKTAPGSGPGCQVHSGWFRAAFYRCQVGHGLPTAPDGPASAGRQTASDLAEANVAAATKATVQALSTKAA